MITYIWLNTYHKPNFLSWSILKNFLIFSVESAFSLWLIKILEYSTSQSFDKENLLTCTLFNEQFIQDGLVLVNIWNLAKFDDSLNYSCCLIAYLSSLIYIQFSYIFSKFYAFLKIYINFFYLWNLVFQSETVGVANESVAYKKHIIYMTDCKADGMEYGNTIEYLWVRKMFPVVRRQPLSIIESLNWHAHCIMSFLTRIST